MDIDLRIFPPKQRREHFCKSPIDGQVLKEFTTSALEWLKTNQQSVNALNVFPVPDGDTGTNMALTMQAAYDEIAESRERNVGKMAHAIAHGALMGARGNSGVILSQLWRGFARALDNQDNLDGPSLVRAFATGRDTAYKGVVRPVEGTILTVAKDIASAAEQALTETEVVVEILERVVDAADISVQHTPELLPVLKEAGVVDAGGKGLFYLLEGMVRFINGLPLDTALSSIQPLAAMQLEGTMEAIEPGQDYEVIVDFHPHVPLSLDQFYQDLEQMGTSIQVGEGEGMYRLHIHVPNEKRYEPIDYVMSIGTITKVAMENLMAQMEAIGKRTEQNKIDLAAVDPGQIAVVSVAPGPGIARVFASLGAAAIVEGGQTMNPSTQEIFKAFENLPTEKIVILPNNKNILLAAQAATHLTNKKVAVIPSRSVPQGLAAMLRLAPDGDFDKVTKDMEGALHEVETGEITTATRSVELDGVNCMAGEYIALHNGKMIHSSPSVEESCLGFLEKANASQYELITLFYGAGVTHQEASRVASLIRSKYPDQEVELQEGGQPHYHFIIALE